PHPLNLFRVHWFNDPQGQRAQIPQHVVLPRSLTGVAAPIVVMLGTWFPMIRAHKVLAAYGCLAPRILSGQFDPTEHMALWPSTGNYCRGGVAISRIMGCRGVAILPEGMSRERFEWLENWVADPSDIVRTPGSESNVKEIYDKCAELDRDPHNIIFNQFSEFGNHLVHYLCTGKALSRVFEEGKKHHPDWNLRAYVSASGSAGTLAAGDYVKDRYGSRIVVSEALECPTLLQNGFGEHNIQGIGDKHVPLIHNVMNTDFVGAVSDEATDTLDILFNSEVGKRYLADKKDVPVKVIEQLSHFGFSAICNVLNAIKTAKYMDWGENDVVMTVATDGAELYATEHASYMQKRFAGKFEETDAAEAYGRFLAGQATDNLLELSHVDRKRIFNLGYFTWVEQQGISLSDFEQRRDQNFWKGLQDLLPAWDAMIDEFNAKTGVLKEMG
ncbi:MAG: pyridoxal-5'-phosphate-dependent protein subunit beta, partial [Candidatus Eisenbacteria bacterium]|nr:pyridoxal-5'-phosphate-dependent protein subunit beta [Candidatus Eisenbacteria bacterium]